MNKVLLGILSAIAVASSAQPALCKMDVLGSGIADLDGAGVIEIAVRPSADAVAVANQLKTTLQLSHGARMKVLEALPGLINVRFVRAPAGATVVASLPEETRRQLADLGLLGPMPVASAGSGASTGLLAGGGTSVAAGGISTGVLAAGGTSVAAGGVVAGLQGAGVFSGGSGTGGGIRPPAPVPSKSQ